ncbi:MAG TPA: agmatine deiminase family protein [Bacteroidales bacterium]|nr:agmatine deiminase family protein [Bacteroidales bacterium]
MKKLLIALFLLIILAANSFAQHLGGAAPYEFQAKYHMLDSSELWSPLFDNKSFTQTPPPAGSVRPVAEWEPAQAVLVTYPGQFGIPYPLIAEMSQDCNVITIVESSTQRTTVRNNYVSYGVDTSHCRYIIAPLDSYWCRDYGPWFVMTNDTAVGILDFKYNRTSRPNDDNVPVVLAGASYLNMPLYGMNMYHTGGNYMCDGYKAAAMTDLVEDENTSLTHAQIDTAFKQYMGITNNYITTDPLGDYIKHIDCWGKFLDVDKILIASVPTSNSQYSDYEAMATYWANQISSYGNNYQVYRVYEPNGQPYTNSLILNNKVFVPFVPNNTTNNNNALAVYQQAMPGYEILGFSSSSWQSTDALHCRTHEIADKGMLYIKHYPLLGQKPVQSLYAINAEIYALSGSNIIADSVYIKYRVFHNSWGVWNKILMTHTMGNSWTASIPQQQSGDTIVYYVHASDLSPRNVMHPLIGQPDPHKFYLYGSSTAVAENGNVKALVFPNPAVDYLFIQMKNASNSAMSVRIFDMVGKEIMTINENNPLDHMIRVDVSKFTAGTYFLKITCGSLSETRKINLIH